MLPYQKWLPAWHAPQGDQCAVRGRHGPDEAVGVQVRCNPRPPFPPPLLFFLMLFSNDGPHEPL
jgi:hypothetical protein